MNTRGFNDASLVGFRGVAVTLPVSQPLHHLSVLLYLSAYKGEEEKRRRLGDTNKF
jgi:hypothetical protein